MLLEFLSRLETISVARSPEEKRACARFSYDIYVRELGYTPPGADHEQGVVWDAHDQLPSTVHLYAGTIGDIRASMRMIVWEPGAVDPGFYATYCMERFPGIEGLKTAELGRLMIHPKARGKLILPSLTYTAYEVAVGEHYVDLAFAECRPGLVPHYRKMGMRPYDAPLTRTPEGFMIPMVNVLCDIDYYEAVGAISARQCRKWFLSGKRRTVDLAPFAPLFDEDNQRVAFDADQVWSAVEADLVRTRSHPTLFESLSEKTMKKIIEGSLVLPVAAGADVAVAGRQESELFLVLEGEFRVLVNGYTVATLGPGEVFGEIAFFRDTGIRSATVQALEDGRLLALRRTFITRLRKEDPDAACTLLFNLGRVLANRVLTADARGLGESPPR